MLNLAIIPGDAVGPELAAEAEKLLRCVAKRAGLALQITPLCAGGPAVERWGDPLPPEVKQQAAACDAVLYGNAGSARYAALPPQQNPARALLELRRAFGVTTNLRPVLLRPAQLAYSPLKPEVVGQGFDILLVRDIHGGMLAARQRRYADATQHHASDLEYYDEKTIRQTAHTAFRAARGRRGRVTSLDKANVLASSLLWRQTVEKIAPAYPDVTLEHRYIDAAAMEVIRKPQQFDVLLTSNVFGDILADELAQLTGTPALFGSAELAADGRGLYTLNQLHHPGEAHAGQGWVCPAGIFHAVALLLRNTAGRPDLAKAVQQAIAAVLDAGYATGELHQPGNTILSTAAFGDKVCQAVAL